MKDWLRRADPAFYAKEPYMLRAEAQIARYTEDAQAEARSNVLRADRGLHVMVAIAAAATAIAALGAGALDLRATLFTAFALIVLAAVVVLTARRWMKHPRVVMWVAFGAVLLACACAFALNGATLGLRLPAEMAAIAVAFLGVCVVAGRIRRAELLARPEGLLSLPQSIVPLLDRSHDHAVICWYD